MSKIKLVVFKDHTLGYILPEIPNSVQHLHSSILRGATFSVSKCNDIIDNPKDIRLATEKDFNEYNVSFIGFDNQNIYEYKI